MLTLTPKLSLLSLHSILSILFKIANALYTINSISAKTLLDGQKNKQLAVTDFENGNLLGFT